MTARLPGLHRTSAREQDFTGVSPSGHARRVGSQRHSPSEVRQHGPRAQSDTTLDPVWRSQMHTSPAYALHDGGSQVHFDAGAGQSRSAQQIPALGPQAVSLGAEATPFDVLGTTHAQYRSLVELVFHSQLVAVALRADARRVSQTSEHEACTHAAIAFAAGSTSSS